MTMKIRILETVHTYLKEKVEQKCSSFFFFKKRVTNKITSAIIKYNGGEYLNEKTNKV
jgi:hypothetical protein